MKVFTPFGDNRRRNNAVMARLACKFAYATDANDQQQITTHLLEYGNVESVEWWSRDNAHGLLVFIHGGVLIGIAGTNDEEDWLTNADVRSDWLTDEWGRANGVEISRGATECYVHAGFAGFAAKIANELQDRIDSQREVAIGGHSLGGATGYVLQLFRPFEAAHCYTYGAPKAFRKTSAMPPRVRFATRRVFDPVPYVPAIYFQHPEAQTVYVSRTGIRTGVKPYEVPIVCVLAGLYWSLGLLGTLLAKCRLSIPSWLRISAAHSGNDYAKLVV